jgi:valyl-tRNA synthetase
MMSMMPRYDPKEMEPRLQDQWEREGVYRYQRGTIGPIFSIDTPPPTVSGHLHLGHVYSYSQTDFMARFWRMNGYDVFYPMGFDDNGLPTERLVEKQLGMNARAIGRQTFIERCLQISKEIGEEYRLLWRRLGLSIDWDYSYRTIGKLARRTSQLSFIHLYRKGMSYRDLAPSIWCSECQTALAQADLNDLQRERKLYTIAFHSEDGSILPIATTRPELLPACVAVFIHPEDERRRALIGQRAITPLFEYKVPILEDAQVDRSKGTGIVMCCTFGDTTDIDWWRTYHLPLRTILNEEGRLTQEAGDFAGMKASDAHHRMVAALAGQGFLLNEQVFPQIVRVHERCDTPVEYLVSKQWFIRILDFKDQFLRAGEGIKWHPEYMKMRYRQWVENLSWDWLISRQNVGKRSLLRRSACRSIR